MTTLNQNRDQMYIVNNFSKKGPNWTKLTKIMTWLIKKPILGLKRQNWTKIWIKLF